MVGNTFQVAIVGLGGMGNWHRELIADVENMEICGSFDIKEERQQFAREHGITSYNSFEEVLQDEKVDIVLCATPNDAHKDIVIRALKAGKHAICEKPATMYSKDFEEMMAVAK